MQCVIPPTYLGDIQLISPSKISWVALLVGALISGNFSSPNTCPKAISSSATKLLSVEFNPTLWFASPTKLPQLHQSFDLKCEMWKSRYDCWIGIWIAKILWFILRKERVPLSQYSHLSHSCSLFKRQNDYSCWNCLWLDEDAYC